MKRFKQIFFGLAALGVVADTGHLPIGIIGGFGARWGQCGLPFVDRENRTRTRGLLIERLAGFAYAFIDIR